MKKPAKVPTSLLSQPKYIYTFEEGNGKDKTLLGGKGAGLCEMTRLGLPVPPGFVVSVKACEFYYANNKQLPPKFNDELAEHVGNLQKKTGKTFGDRKIPLLVSVRSGAAMSMPGMMDTILNLGMNDEVAESMAELTGDARFAYDSYRRLIQMFGKIVFGIEGELFDEEMEAARERQRVPPAGGLDVDGLRNLVERFKEICKQAAHEFPQEPEVQLKLAIKAVLESWNTPRCVYYRKANRITSEMASGTAANVVTMVFGNLGGSSGTGVGFTRNPENGQNELYGEYLLNAQGEDVVAGIRTPKPIKEMQKELPEIYSELKLYSEKLEQHFREVQDFEFTIERGKLFLLQTRNGKMNAAATVRTSLDFLQEGLIDKTEALLRVKPEQIEQLLHKRVDPAAKRETIAQGIPASPGAASGVAVFDADTAERWKGQGKKVILVREETKPEDVHGFYSSEGILTERGGKTSHAAVVARGIGKPCVVGCEEIKISLLQRQFRTVSGKIVSEGDWITIDGLAGQVFLGQVPTIEPKPSEHMLALLRLADEARVLRIRANADTAQDAKRARDLGAEGIGLCRTERMFNASDRLPIVQKMILAETKDERQEYLERLKPLQKEDFKAILIAMEGLPVTIRLLDPPLHEFLPSVEELTHAIEEAKARRDDPAKIREMERLVARSRALREVNPMLGHRGVRVGVTYPEIYEMQVSAILEACQDLLQQRHEVKPEIMIPQVAAAEELVWVKERVESVAKQLFEKRGITVNFKYGTMTETVRACVTSGKIAEVVDFCSFGTNDLTQATYSFSREDAEGKFLPDYVEKHIVPQNPFEILDKEGVYRLMQLAVKEGREAKPTLTFGICGEHGGEPESVILCHEAGLNYVSCSPYRVPVARLAAAHGALKRRQRQIDV